MDPQTKPLVSPRHAVVVRMLGYNVMGAWVSTEELLVEATTTKPIGPLLPN